MSCPTRIILLLLAFSTAVHSQDAGTITASGKDGRCTGKIEAVNFDRVILKAATGKTHDVRMDDVEPIHLPQVLKWLSLKMPSLSPSASRLRATLTKTSKTNLKRIKQPTSKGTEKSTGVAYQAQISNSGAEDFSDVTLLLLIGYVLEKDTSESRPSKYRALQLRKAKVAQIPAGEIASAAFEVFWEIDSQIINELSQSNFAGRKSGTSYFIAKSKTKIESAQLLVLDSSGRLLYQYRL